MKLTEDEMDEFDVLLCAWEDMCALWEAREELEDKPRAVKAIKSLYSKGWISLWLAKSWTDWDERKLNPQEAEVLIDKLEDDCYWYTSGDVSKGFYCFFITPEGDRIYHEDKTEYFKEGWAKRKQRWGISKV